jgi:hypothetical protein
VWQFLKNLKMELPYDAAIPSWAYRYIPLDKEIKDII